MPASMVPMTVTSSPRIMGCGGVCMGPVLAAQISKLIILAMMKPPMVIQISAAAAGDHQARLVEEAADIFRVQHIDRPNTMNGSEPTI